jgi:sugar phosphate isomerase/epimerase
MKMEKTPEFSLSYLTVFGTPPERQVEIASEVGYDCVSVRFTAVTEDEEPFPLLTDHGLVRRFKSRLDATGMAVLDAELIRIGPDDDPGEYERFMEVAKEIGARHLIVQLPDPDRTRAVEHFVQVCELADLFDLTADLEFLPWSPTVDLDAAADIVMRAARPNGGIVIDTLHFGRSRSTVEQLRSLPPELFRLVQLCDAPREAPDDRDGLIRAARTARSLPGEAGLDLRPLIDALPQVSYALEVPNDRMRADLGTEEFARRVLEAARRFVMGSGRVASTSLQ